MGKRIWVLIAVVAFAGLGVVAGACGGDDEGGEAAPAAAAAADASIAAAIPELAALSQESPPPQERVEPFAVAADITLSPGGSSEPAAQRAPQLPLPPVVALDVPVAFVMADGDWEIALLSPDGTLSKLTDDEEDDRVPALSPDGTKIAFHSYRDGNWNVYVMNADGSELTQLTDDPAVDAYPAWSPDGSTIAFHSSRSGSWQVYTMNADGRDPVQVSSEGGESPAFSPDGSQLVWAADSDGDGVYSLYVANADGSEVSALTPEDQDAYAPEWSPDGSMIAYEGAADGDLDVFVVNADGSGLTNLTVDSPADAAPTWLPDGRILFHSDRNVADYPDIFVMNADGSEVGQVTTSDVSEWSPSVGRTPGGGGEPGPEEELLSHVPEEIRATCEPTDLWYEGTLAQVYCGAGDIGVNYILFADAEGMHSEYEAISGGLRDQGSCDTDDASEGPYWIGDSETPAGRFLCFDEGGGRRAVWENDELVILSAAFHGSADRQALYDFWSGAGPYP